MSTTSRAAAGRWTRVSQVALGVSLGVGALLAVAGVPGFARSEVPGARSIPVVDLGIELAQRQDPSRAPVDLWAVSDRLSAVTNRPTIAEAAVVPVGAAVPPPPAPAPPEIRYLGIARIGSLTRALINDNGRQRFVRVGDAVSMGVVLLIEPEHIEVGPEGATGEARTRIDLAARAMALARAAAPITTQANAAKLRAALATKTLVAPGSVKLGSGTEMSTTISGVNPRSSKFSQRPPGANQPTPPPRPGFKPTVQETLAERKRREDLRAMLKINNGEAYKSEQDLTDAVEKIFAEEQEARRREKE